METSGDSPLALPFDEAIQPSVFLLHLRTSAENQARRELASLGNDAFKAALAGAKFIFDSTGLQVVFEGGIPKGAKLMRDVAGKALPTLVDGKTGGKILKNSRVVSSGRKATSAGAGAILVIVEAAHMISGYDNAQRLKKVECGVDALVHAHRSELKSRMEAIYSHCKELIRGDLNQLTEHERQELHRQCRELMELRFRWREDFRHRLNAIKPAEPGFFDSLLRRKEEGLKKDRQRKAKDAVEAMEMVQLMHFSLMLQMTLAGASGRMESFQKITLPDECDYWSGLLAFASKRSKEICGNSVAEEFHPLLYAVNDLVVFWSMGRPVGERNQYILAGHDKQAQPDAPTRKKVPSALKSSILPIVLRCPECQQTVRRRGDRRKRVANCPSCKAQFRIDPLTK